MRAPVAPVALGAAAAARASVLVASGLRRAVEPDSADAAGVLITTGVQAASPDPAPAGTAAGVPTPGPAPGAPVPGCGTNSNGTQRQRPRCCLAQLPPAARLRHAQQVRAQGLAPREARRQQALADHLELSQQAPGRSLAQKAARFVQAPPGQASHWLLTRELAWQPRTRRGAGVLRKYPADRPGAERCLHCRTPGNRASRAGTLGAHGAGHGLRRNNPGNLARRASAYGE